LVDLAGGPKGDGLNKQITGGKYKGILKTKLDGFDQADYLEGKAEKSARDSFFYYMGAVPSAVRYKNWKFYYTMPGETAVGGLLPPTPYKWTQIQNILRDPFEQNVGMDQKSLMALTGALAGPTSAYLYDWNILPIGQLLWQKELMSYKEFPPLQQAASYNLDQILQQINEHGNPSQ
jgi:hypothetical protein